MGFQEKLLIAYISLTGAGRETISMSGGLPACYAHFPAALAFYHF